MVYKSVLTTTDLFWADFISGDPPEMLSRLGLSESGYKRPLPAPKLTHPTIYVTCNREECNYLIRQLFDTSKHVSVDIEGTLRRLAHPNAPSVVQFSSSTTCLIIQLYRMLSLELKRCALPRNPMADFTEIRQRTLKTIELPSELLKLLYSSSTVKIGFGVHQDMRLLALHYALEFHKISALLDISETISPLGLPTSLAGLSELLCPGSIYGKKESDRYNSWRNHKGRDWDKEELTKAELVYASADVFAIFALLSNLLVKEINVLQNAGAGSVFDFVLLPDISEERVGLETLNDSDSLYEDDDLVFDIL